MQGDKYRMKPPVKILNIKNLFNINSIKQGDICPENIGFLSFFSARYIPSGRHNRTGNVMILRSHIVYGKAGIRNK